jgi:cell division protein FtsB
VNRLKNGNMKNKKKKRNKFLWRGLFLFAVVYVIVSVISLRLQINEAQQKLTFLTEQLKQQEIQNSKLDDLLTADEQKQIEQTARDKLGLVYPDERVYIDIS